MFVQNISRFNDETPPSPDHAGGCESDVLGKGETLSWSSKVTNAGEDNAPLARSQLRGSTGTTKHFCRRTFMTGALEGSLVIEYSYCKSVLPEMHSLDTHRTVP